MRTIRVLALAKAAGVKGDEIAEVQRLADAVKAAKVRIKGALKTRAEASLRRLEKVDPEGLEQVMRDQGGVVWEGACLTSPWGEAASTPGGSPESMPSMERSSSSASQCRPKGLMVTAARCCGVAFRRRGNPATGTPRVRPSDRPTHIVSSSNRTSVAEVVMPCVVDFRRASGDVR